MTPVTVPEFAADIEPTTEPMRFGLWLVTDGESVRAGERLAEVLLPGIVWNISATVTGQVHPLDIPSGTPLRPGETIGHIE